MKVIIVTVLGNFAESSMGILKKINANYTYA